MSHKLGSVLIKNGTVLRESGPVAADVLVGADGIVADVAPNLAPPADGEIVDAAGMLVAPGGIDPHVHLNFLFNGRTTKHGEAEGRELALSNGITVLGDFLIDADGSLSPTELLARRRAELDGLGLPVHFYYVFQEDHPRVAEYIEELRGTDVRVVIFGFYKTWDADTMRKYLPLLKGRFSLGCHVLSIDGEDVPVSEFSDACLSLRSKIDDIEKRIFYFHKELAEEAGVPLHFLHLSNPDLLDVPMAVPTFREVTHQHLFYPLERALASKDGRYMTGGPWLQPKARQEELLEKIRFVDCIASDDAAFDVEDKLATSKGGNMIKGLPSLGYRLPFLVTYGLREKKLDLSDFYRLWHGGAAKAFGIPDGLTPGNRADFAVIDPERPFSRPGVDGVLGWEPFPEPLFGAAIYVMANGATVLRDGATQKGGEGRG